MSLRITPRGFVPAVALRGDGELVVERDTLAAPGDRFASALELAAIASDDVATPMIAAAGGSVIAQRRLISRIQRELRLAARRHRGARRVRTESAAATILLDLFVGARARVRAATTLRRDALDAYRAIMTSTRSTRLFESMTANLDRRRALLDDDGRAALDAAWATILPQAPPYASWFGGDGHGDGTLRVLCQVQDVFFPLWQHELRTLGFRSDGHGTRKRIKYAREDVVAGRTTRIEIDYVEKGEGIFTAMHDPRVDAVCFLGHSDWWARVPRNLAHAPDQVGDKLLVLVMCFGKHFYHALHERYPRAHIVTTKDPTEDPEDVALFRHLFAGISARKSWAAIRRGSIADRRTADNFIFPGDARYVAGVLDEDRDGRLDRFDRFCNVGAPRQLAAVTGEQAFVPDPPALHPRGAELDPRELDGGPVFEAALMLNSLSYDNYWLDQVNQDQRVVSGGWHHVAPGDFTATRFATARMVGERREVVRMSVSTRYARAPQPALTAMVVYDGWSWLAQQLPRRARLSPIDRSVMGVMLVAHALANSDYHRPEEVFHAFVRRWGLPAHLSFATAVKTIETDDRWESGSPRAVARFQEQLPPAALTRWRQLLGEVGGK